MKTKNRLYILVSAVVLTAVLASSCHRHKKEEVDFAVQMERVTSSDSNSAKTYLCNAEQWVCWEVGDKIDIVENNETSKVVEDIVVNSGMGTQHASFHGTLTSGEMPRYAFSPQGIFKSRAGNAFTITLPHEQPYRTVGGGTHPDSSFASNVLPMVSYCNSSLYNLYFHFHPVCGILRLQFYSSSLSNITINSIDIVSKDNQISGDFTVPAGQNHAGHVVIQDPEPYIESASDAAADKVVTITGINQPIGGSNRDKLYTFYLPLPATKDLTQAQPYDFNTDYTLRVTVHCQQTVDGNTEYIKCEKILTASIHRCNITKMRALDLTSFVLDASGNHGTASVQLVGSGTKDRPFQIYSPQDLELVRQAFNRDDPNTPVYINGQRVLGIGESAKDGSTAGPTYFKIVRSDINLLTADQYAAWEADDVNYSTDTGIVWTAGIKYFKGIMYFATSSATRAGICNTSGKPIFEHICTDGRVEGIYVRGSMTGVQSSDDYFSPLCHHNYGTIKDCHNLCNVTMDNYGPHERILAGICGYNHGVIDGGANEGNLRSENSAVACICGRNDGIIRGSFNMSRSIPVAEEIAGVCYDNYQDIEDCLVSSNVNPINSSGNWGVIVYNNRGTGTITNCRSAGALVYTTTGSIGGICHTNWGIVKNSSLQVVLQGGSGSIGGIVSVMEGGEVYNCKSDGDHWINGAVNDNVADNAGGIVGWLKGGSVRNCYNQCNVNLAINTGGIVGRVELESYYDDEDEIRQRPIENCWCANGQHFKGATDTIHKLGINCFSANVADYDTVVGCNIINTSDYTISHVQNFIDNEDTPGDIDAYNAFGLSEGDDLVDFLNAWVVANDSKYWRWDEDTTPPTFLFGTGTKKSSSRQVPRKKNPAGHFRNLSNHCPAQKKTNTIIYNK